MPALHAKTGAAAAAPPPPHTHTPTNPTPPHPPTHTTTSSPTNKKASGSVLGYVLHEVYREGDVVRRWESWLLQRCCLLARCHVCTFAAVLVMHISRLSSHIPRSIFSTWCPSPCPKLSALDWTHCQHWSRTRLRTPST